MVHKLSLYTAHYNLSNLIFRPGPFTPEIPRQVGPILLAFHNPFENEKF